VFPDRFQELLPAEHLAGCGGQRQQQPQFGRGERDRGALPGDRVPGAVDGQIAVRVDLRYAAVGRRSGRRPAQDGPDARLQDPGPHGLDDVVVGSGLQSHDDVHVVAARGRHEDRQRLVQGTHGAAHVQAGHAGQHQVEHHDVRPEGPQPLQPLLPGLGGGDVVSLAAQGEGDSLTDGAVVFDQQNSWHGLSIRRAHMVRAPVTG
jgi:hypothetical protein